MGSWKGNWQIAKPDKASQHRATSDHISSLNQAALNDRLPAIERPCGTPGAVYSITVRGCNLKCAVRLPFNIASAVPEAAHEDMKKAMHDAVLPIIEKFYRDVWDETIAGKRLGDDPDKMPKHWKWLFTKYIRRCFQRGERALIDGRWREERYDRLPPHYRWGPDD